MSDAAVSAESGQYIKPKARGFFADFFVRLFREKPLGAVGGIIFAILVGYSR